MTLGKLVYTVSPVPLFLVRGETSVSQADLVNIRMLDNQVLRLLRVRDRIAQGVMDRLNAGAAVECGVFEAEIEEIRRGSSRRQKLIVR